MIKLNAKETKISIGKYAGTYRYVLSPMLYTTLPASKVIEEAVVRSGISKGTITAAYQAIGDTVLPFPVLESCASDFVPTVWRKPRRWQAT